MRRLYSVTTKVGGDLLTVRGNSADEFVENLTSLNDNPLFPDAMVTFQSLGSGTTVQQAVQNVKAAMPGTTEVGGEPEVMTNQKGTKYTRAIRMPDHSRRSEDALMEGTNAKGAFKGWVDPTSGPWPTLGRQQEKTRWLW